MYLFFRHPLRGGKIHDMSDEVRDETLSMGEKALFIEHPTDKSNAVKVSQLSSFSLPGLTRRKFLTPSWALI